MLRKKNIQTVQPIDNQPAMETPSLSRLEQINALERQVIAILGRSNIIVDPDRDLFSRLEELYLSHLQRQPLGLQMLERVVRLIGQVDAPAKVRMLYLIARETYLADGDPVRALQQGFKCNLNLKQKNLTGFQCGLLLAEMSKNPRYVQVTLNTLIVSLENEIGFRPTGLRYHKVHNESKTTGDFIKKVYIGGPIKQRSTCKSSYDVGKLKRLDFSKCLYEAYMTGFKRLQSQAKRRYYADCLNELKKRLIRQNPGLRLEERLNLIDQGQTLLKLFSHPIVHQEKRAQKILDFQEKSEIKSQFINSQYKEKRSVSEARGKNEVEFQKKVVQCSTGDQFFSSNNSNLTSHSELKSLKIGLKEVDQCNRLNSRSTSSHRNRKPNRSLKKQQNKINLVEVAEKENKRSIVLKFDRIQSEGQNHFQIKKKKLKAPILWDQKKIQKRMVVNVVNVNCLPQIKEESHRDFAMQTEIQEESKCKMKTQKPQKDHPVESLQSLCEKTSAERIDFILKQGLDWSSCLDTEKVVQENHHTYLQNTKMKEKRVIGLLQKPSEQLKSNFEFKNANSMDLQLEQNPLTLLNPDKCRQQSQLTEYQHDSFSQTRKILVTNQKISANTLKSTQANKIEYKIVIRNLQGELITINNQIIAQEIGLFLQRLSESIIQQQCIIQEQGIQKIQQKEQITQEKLNLQFENDQLKRNSTTFSDLVKQFDRETQQVAKIEELADNSYCFKEVIQDKSRKINIQQLNQKYQILKDTIEFVETITGEFNILTDEVVNKCYLQQIKNQEDEQNEQKQIKCKQKLRDYYIRKEQISFYIFNLTNQIENIYLFFDNFGQFLQKKQMESTQQTFKILCPQIQRNSDSEYDDSDLSSEIHTVSCNKVDLPINQEVQQKIQKENHQRKSQNINFSRFALQKLTNSKKSFSRSNSQHINQDGLSNLKQSLMKGKHHNNDVILKKKKSRSNSNGSVEADIETIMKVNTKRNSSQIQIPLPSNSSLQNLKQQILCFDHWLKPQVRIINNKIQLKISHPDQLGKCAKRYELIPQILMQQIDLMKKVQIQIKDYLERVGGKKVRWEDIVFQLDDLRLLPDEIEVLTVNVRDEVQKSDLCLRFYFRSKSRDILGKCLQKKLKIPILDIKQNGTSSQLIQKINAQNIIIRKQEVFFNDIWVITGHRNIKLRDKYQNTVNHCVFQVLQLFNTATNMISFMIKTQTNESMKFDGVAFEQQTKILSNIDTIIGFALKIENKKMVFNGEHIKDLIKLL